MTIKHTLWTLIFFTFLLCSCGGNGGGPASGSQDIRELLAPTGELTDPQVRNGRELFFADSLNAYLITRPYPVPTCAYSPAPKGYKPVYISSYARHGSRKLYKDSYCRVLVETFAYADSVGGLTPLGKEVYAKISAIYKDLYKSVGDLTEVGVEQHRGIGERMYRNYRNIFKAGAPVRFYSTAVQRTIMSMSSCNVRLLELCPKLVTTQKASSSLTYLSWKINDPYKAEINVPADEFIADYLDIKPVLERLFTCDMPVIEDSAVFIRNLHLCGSIVASLDIEGVDFLWDLFTHEELFTLQQAQNYMMYVRTSNSPLLGDVTMPAIRPLLRDFMEKADTALERKVPGADLRFGHDNYVIALTALVGINGYVKREEDPLKVIDVFQDFIAAPMAGNIQMVFYRNRSGDVLVKFLLNEVESWIPIPTDIMPYYHWDEVHDYFESLLGK